MIEVTASDFPTSSNSKKRRRTKVVPHDVIEIDEDDSAGFVNISEKGSAGNKRKGNLTSNKDWGYQIKDALNQNLMMPASATEPGLTSDIQGNYVKSPWIGFNFLDSFNEESVNYGFGDYPYTHYNSSSLFNGTVGFQAPSAALNLSAGLGASTPWVQQPSVIYGNAVPSSSLSTPNLSSSGWYKDKDDFWLQQHTQTQKKPASTSRSTLPQPSCTMDKEEDKYGVLEKYRSFKRFDTVSDYLDHHYQKSHAKQPQRNWAKVIQQEWKILEKDLPDTISVRVYEERMDLLRAVIVGAAGTPYHDGLFFFDFHFPYNYPNAPPQVFYHSGGLRLNPNLYNCGKVCLSLLNTWQGRKEEKWTPRKSTVLQVLLSIQALVLNAKPYFNEPGYASSAGSIAGEKQAHAYNESTFILSCRTMLFTLRKPPRHFEEFVAGHYREHAHAILVACKAYMDGAQVGCLVGGGVQDVDEGDTSCSQNFRTQVGTMVQTLVPAFVQNGSKDCTQFLPPQTNSNRNNTDTIPRPCGYGYGYGY